MGRQTDEQMNRNILIYLINFISHFMHSYLYFAIIRITLKKTNFFEIYLLFYIKKNNKK